MATSVHFWSINGTFRPLPVQRRQLPAAFGAAVVPSINFRCINETLQQLLVKGGNFRLLPERQRTSVSFPCIRGSVHQLSVHPRDHLSTFRASVGPFVNKRQISVLPQDLPSTFRVSTGPSVNFPSGHGTFCQLLKTFLASVGPSVSFHQLSVHPWDLPLTFHASTGFSVNFPCGCGSFHKLLSTFCAAKVPSVNFPFSRGTIRQLSVHQGDLP